MSNITVNIKGIGNHEFISGISPLQIMSETEGIPKDSIICKIDGVLVDLSTPLLSNCELKFMDAKSKEGHSVLLHSTAHLMAQAVKRLYPDTKVTIGPFLDNRFYYDFDVDIPFTEQDLLKIEDEMLKISNENLSIDNEVKSRKEAISYFEEIDESYKVEIINKKNNIISCKVIEKVRVQYYEPELNLIFSLVKKDRIFNIIEKCTELGVTCFHPIVTERTQNFNYSFKKFGAYAIEASEQTRRLTIPKINPIQKQS